MPKSALPRHLKNERHWDWPWPFKHIPRAWTAFNWGWPTMVWGNQKEVRRCEKGWDYRKVKDSIIMIEYRPSPIGEPNSWQVSRFREGPFFAWYFSWSGKRGKDGKFRHFRVGARWDNVDDYVQFPSVALRKYTGEAIEDTSTK